MMQQELDELVQCGRRISEGEIRQICETVELFPNLSIKELTTTICEHLGWYTAAGGLKEDVGRYHPLSYKQPFGYRMRYFVVCRQGPLGCLLFSGAAKSLGARDRWIGWTEIQRLQRLAWVVNLSRHLVFPWVQVPNLSSHVLGQLARRISTDWHSRWGYRPVLMETFVDPRSHEGSCYRAAGWNDLGMTTGEGLVRPGHSYTTTAKKIFVRPLVREFRHLLCSEIPVVRDQP